MDWARGLAARGGCLVAEVAREGTVEYVNLSTLQERGLPDDTSTRRGRIQLDFGNWSRTDPSEYLRAFGIEDVTSAASDHQMFFAVHRGVKLVVPALVWIRALIRPSEHFLALAFGPHFLDRVSCVTSGDGDAKVVVDTPWATKSQTKRRSSAEQAIVWMRAHPSATSMVGSVHRWAMEGAVGLDLPSGHAELSVRGRRVGKTIFVTDMSVQVVQAGDEPIQGIADASGRYVLTGSPAESGSCASFHVSNFEGVPTHSAGQSDVTDEEWDAVSGFLTTPGKAPTLDQRAILDGLLCKLSTGMAWKSVPYRVGNHQNAIQAFRAWAGRGALQQVLETLMEFRAHAT